jgi:hypothetical protein
MRKLLFEIVEPEIMAPGGALRPVARAARADGRTRVANATFFALSLVLLGALAHIAMRVL